MDRSKRKPVIVANWKMHKTIKETVDYIRLLNSRVVKDGLEIFLAVPYTVIQKAAETATKTRIVVGAQNMHEGDSGSFTGEISARMLKDAGAKFVILGHSERRSHFHEKDALVNKKVIKALEEGLIPIVCVGETLHERKEGRSQEIVEQQIKLCLEGVTAHQAHTLIIAYEPVWAIGTNCAATPNMAQEVHAFCRTTLESLFSTNVAEKMRIIYGGSVKPENCVPLMVEKDIDGLLVGGASLNADIFSQIVNFE